MASVKHKTAHMSAHFDCPQASAASLSDAASQQTQLHVLDHLSSHLGTTYIASLGYSFPSIYQ